MERRTGWAERLLLTGCSFGSERIGAKRGLGQAAVAKAYQSTSELTQRFARHASPLSTTVYTHPTDEELFEGIRGLKV
jgi:hypothetical protein